MLDLFCAMFTVNSTMLLRRIIQTFARNSSIGGAPIIEYEMPMASASLGNCQLKHLWRYAGKLTMNTSVSVLCFLLDMVHE